MSGIGAEGAFGAQGTYNGLADWMRGQRRQVVEGQQDQDRLRNQSMQDQEAGVARQELLRQHARQDMGDKRLDTLFQQGQQDRATEQAATAQHAQGQAELLAQIDALDLPPLAKLGAKITVQKGGQLPPQLFEMLKPAKQNLHIAPNGQVVNMDDPSIVGKNFAAPHEHTAAASEPLIAIKDPVTGQPKLVPRSQAVGAAPASTRDQAMTEGQSNAAGFAERMKFNEGYIQKHEAAAVAGATGRWNQLKGAVLPNEMQSDSSKSYEAAKRNWMAANLRKESGAAIGPNEYTEANQQYFRQPGESDAIADQKRQLRAVAEAAMRRSSGHGNASSEPMTGPPTGGADNDLGKEW